jgi:membrane protein implicated in regulation of membrane protease activity
MEFNQNNNNKINDFSVSHFSIMFLGFVVFITGLFLVAYSFFAWLLVANVMQSFIYFGCGVIACYLGRKVIRKMSKKQYIANLVE